MEELNIIFLGCSLIIFFIWVLQWFIHVVSIVYGSHVFHQNYCGQSSFSIKSSAFTFAKSSFSSASSLMQSSLPSFVATPSSDVVYSTLPTTLSSSTYNQNRKTCVGVSVLKPLIGFDDALQENLESFFTLDYPKYELLFCTENEFDESVKLVKKLISKYPKVDAKLFTKASNEHVNPKINNMLQGYAVAKFPLVLISDSNIKMFRNTLEKMVMAMDENTCLVHQMPFICDKPDIASIVEKIYCGTRLAKIYIISHIFGFICITGMSFLFRKYIIDAHGGLETFGKSLAEDYHMSKVLLKSGLRSRICDLPAQQNIGKSSLTVFQNRMKRWSQLRLSLMPLMYLFEPISECIVLGVLTSLASIFLFKWNGLVFFCVHSLIWFLLDYKLFSIIQGTSLPFTKLDFLICWLYRELSCLHFIAGAIASSTFTWRSRTYRIKWWGIGEEIKDSFTV